MTTGVPLDFDADAFRSEQAEKERALLDLARRHSKSKLDRNGKPDEAAALELLLRFAKFGAMNDPTVHEAVIDGMREVAAYVAYETILQKGGAAPQVHPLMFFKGIAEPGKRGVKNKIGKRLELTAAYGDRTMSSSLQGAPLLSHSILRQVLTTRNGKKLRRVDWPARVHRVETLLVEYVLVEHKGASAKEAVWYVHASFDAPWHRPDDVFLYPESWT